MKKYAIELTFLSMRTWKYIELQLYLIILLGQKDRHADALALLEGEIGVKTKATENVELRHLRNELLIKTGRWKDARDATALILKEKYVTRRVSLLETNMALEHVACNVSTTPRAYLPNPFRTLARTTGEQFCST